MTEQTEQMEQTEQLEQPSRAQETLPVAAHVIGRLFPNGLNVWQMIGVDVRIVDGSIDGWCGWYVTGNPCQTSSTVETTCSIH